MFPRIVRAAAVVVLATAALVIAQQPGLFPAIAVKQDPQTPNRLRHLDKLPLKQRQLYLTGLRSFEWLQRANQLDGKFVPGLVPSLGSRPDADPLQPQIEATAVLLEAAAYFRDDKASALGKQALLRMLQETTTDPSQPGLRYTAAPDAFVNRLAASGALLRAIHAMPSPPADLATQGRELLAFVLRQQRTDGSFALASDEPTIQAALMQTSVGPALLGLAKAGRGKSDPALDAVRRACPVYVAFWRQNKTPLMVADHSAAYAEAFAKTGDPALAQAVFEMNDWVLTLQVPQDPSRPLWSGGFPSGQNGMLQSKAPDADSAVLASSLAHACQVAKLTGDAVRYPKYRQGLEDAVQFLATLQYTDARVQHFTEWYRPWILGGFFVSHQDGNLRLAQNQQALSAFVGYLRDTVE
jgi:hypothetical protein